MTKHTTPPIWQPDLSQRRIVCAAIRIRGAEADLIVAGARHFDSVMHGQLAHMVYLNPGAAKKADQGFIDQFGLFLTREEAFKVAEENGQLLNKPTIPGTLFSEDLY